MTSRSNLPIDASLPAILAALNARPDGIAPALAISAPPGSGKTTRVPPALLDHVAGQVLVLEPRRIAARASARRVADELGAELGGDVVGYEVRDDRRVTNATRLRYLTEGVLVRRMVGDPFLEGVSTVILDEFHERHVETDLALAMLREVRDTVRNDLQIVVMSATLDVEPVVRFLAPAAHVPTGGGQPHEVRIEYVDPPREKVSPVDGVRPVVGRALAETAGHVLVFLPGVGEIQRLSADLAALAARDDLLVLPLHGSLPAAEQDVVLAPSTRRKVVLATNVAESSLTIDGVTAVIDTGLARVLRHDPARGLDGLAIETISLASAKQRAGRAGRTGRGVCYRLWSRAAERGMAAFDTAEIRRVDLASPSLLVRVFAGRAPAEFGWFEAPEPAALARADRLLFDLGLLTADGNGVSAAGRAAAGLPVHPRLARMLLEASGSDALPAAALIAAMLSERDVLRHGFARGGDSFGVDLDEQLERLGEFERRGARRADAEALGLDPASARAVLRTRDRLLRIASRAPRLARGDRNARRPAQSKSRERTRPPVVGEPASGDAAAQIGQAVLAGFPDRIAAVQRRPGGDPTTNLAESPGSVIGQLVGGGRGVIVRDPSFQASELLVALRVEDRPGQSRSRVTLAMHVERDWLEAVFADSIEVERTAEFDPAREIVVAITRTRFRDLVLDERRGGTASPGAIETALAAAVCQDPLAHVGTPQRAAIERFLARLAWLRRAEGETSDLPELGTAELAEAIAALVPGKRALRDFRDAPLLDLLEAKLSHTQRARLRREAPDRLRLAGGRELRIDYETDPPHVASRLQDFFGMADGPRIAGGRVPLTLHLLAPNRRPVQITSDLASFWANVYPRVRAELRNRYPKHAWPATP